MSLHKKEIEFNEKIADFKLELDDIDSLGETLEKRYKNNLLLWKLQYLVSKIPENS